MVIDYSKWDNIQLSSDEEMEDGEPLKHEDKLDLKVQPSQPSKFQTKKPKPKGKSGYGNLDYSKWDDLDVSSDEEEDVKPKVTTFNQPSSVTIGPNGYSINKPANPAPQPKRRKLNSMPNSWSQNGNKLADYVWSQTRDFLEVRFFIPTQTPGRDVKIALTTTTCKIIIKGEIFIEGEFCFEILEIEEDVDIDWELTEHPSVEGRILVLTGLEKKVPKGLYNWWDRFFKREEPIDVRELKGRKDPKHQDAWKVAHEMFKNKVKNQGKIPVPIFDENKEVGI